ncbi:MAG: hypothetical protein ACOCQR_02940 [bacterium]
MQGLKKEDIAFLKQLGERLRKDNKYFFYKIRNTKFIEVDNPHDAEEFCLNFYEDYKKFFKKDIEELKMFLKKKYGEKLEEDIVDCITELKDAYSLALNNDIPCASIGVIREYEYFGTFLTKEAAEEYIKKINFVEPKIVSEFAFQNKEVQQLKTILQKF